jgi:hypothetical protein
MSCAQLWQDFNLGRLDEADADARTLPELGQQLGNDLYTMDAIVIRIAVALLRGETDAAPAHLDHADGIIKADDDVRRPGLAVMRGWLASTRGDLDLAFSTLRPVMERSHPGKRLLAAVALLERAVLRNRHPRRGPGVRRHLRQHPELAAARNPGVAVSKASASMSAGAVGTTWT